MTEIKINYYLQLSQIGLYEIMKNKQVSVLDEDGDIDIERLGPLLLYSYVNSITNNAAIDATSKHDDRIREIFSDAINSYSLHRNSPSDTIIISLNSILYSPKG